MKKVYKNMGNNSEEIYRKYMSEKVLSDREIINFIRDNKFTRVDVERNLENFYQYYILKDPKLADNHVPRLICVNGEAQISYTETAEYRLKVQKMQTSNKIKTEFITNNVLAYTFENLSRNRAKGILATEIIKVCRKIINNQSQKGVYIYGTTGIGKTYLLGCIYNYFKNEGIEPTIMYFPEFVRKVKSRITTNDYEYYIDLVRNEKILIIDDIGAENMTEFIRDDVLGPIINYRESEKLPTFFSSNLSIADLQTLLSAGKNSLDYTKGLRIAERIKSLSTEYYLDGENEREYYN